MLAVQHCVRRCNEESGDKHEWDDFHEVRYDIDVIARKFGTMAETYIRLKSEARQIGLVINVSKTKYMMAKGSREVYAHIRAMGFLSARIMRVVT